MPAGSRAAVIPAATIDESHSTGAPPRSAARVAGDDVVGEGDVLGDVDLPAGVDQPDHHPRDVGGESGQVGFGADGRERLAVDLRRVADVVEHPLTLRRDLRQPVSVAGGHQHLAGRRAAAGAFAADEVTMRTGIRVRRACAASARTSATRMRAAGAAGAGADVQPGGVLVEHQAQRRQHPQRDVGDRLRRDRTPAPIATA